MSNDIARLGYEIDSSQARTAAGDLDKMNAAAMKAERGAKSLKAASRDLLRDEGGRFMSAAQAAGKYGDEIDQLRTKYNPLYAASKQFEAQQTELQRALALGAISIGQYDAALAGLQAGMLRSGQSAAVFGKGMQASNHHITNLMFNFQDIAMMLAAGQNPLMLAMQQGTQVSGVFEQMKQSGQSAFGGIKSGLMAMVSPMSLLTLGVIAGGAALVQWGMSALGASDDTKTLTETVDDLENSVSAVNEISKVYSADGLQSLLDKYGEVNGAILAMIENQKTFAIGAAMQSARDAVAAIGGEFEGINTSMALLSRPGGGLGGLLDQLGLTKDQFVALRDAMDEAGSATTFEAQADALGRVNAILARSKVAMSETAGEALEAEAAMRELANAAPQANWMSAAISGVASLGAAIRDRIAEADRLRNAIVPSNGVEGGRGADPRSFVDDRYWSDKFFPSPEAMDFSGDGGGGGATDPYAENLERLITSLQTERDTVDAWYQENLAILTDRRALELMGETAHKSAIEALEMEHQERLSAIQSEASNRRLTDTASLFGELANIAAAGGQKSAKAVATFQAVEGTINAYGAAVKALNTPGLTLAGRFAAYASVLGAGLKGVAAIKAAGGGGGGGASGPTSATSARAEPEKTTRIELMGEDWLVSLAETMMDQIYTASGKGRVIISKANA